MSRAKREQEKRNTLLMIETQRQKLEASWLEWEKEKKKKKIEKKEKAKDAKSQAQLARILRLNEQADRNLDEFNGAKIYTTKNKLLRKQMIGWDRS